LIPYKPKGWSDKIVVSRAKGTHRDSPTLYATDNLYVDLAVLNDNNWKEASTIQVDLYVDGVLKDSWNWNELPSCTYGYVKDYPIGTLKAGTHTIRVEVDGAGGIDESNEEDNEYEKTITVINSDKPNLIFNRQMGWSERVILSNTRRASQDSHPLTIRDKLYVNWSVQNNGGVKTAGKVGVSLYVDEVKTKSWQNARSMRPSATWKKTGQLIGKLSKGEHTVRLVVEGEGLVPGDNEVVKRVNVQEEPWEVGRPELSGSGSSSPGQNGEYRIGGSVCDRGGEVEYLIEWGDGKMEGWFSGGKRNHDWAEGYYQVSGKARCKDYPEIQSEWVLRNVTVVGGGSGGAD